MLDSSVRENANASATSTVLVVNANANVNVKAITTSQRECTSKRGQKWKLACKRKHECERNREREPNANASWNTNANAIANANAKSERKLKRYSLRQRSLNYCCYLDYIHPRSQKDRSLSWWIKGWSYPCYRHLENIQKKYLLRRTEKWLIKWLIDIDWTSIHIEK